MLGRKGDGQFDIEEALLLVANRDPTLWQVLRDFLKRLDIFNLKLWLIIALTASNNKWIDKALELVGAAPAAAATLLHHLNH